MPPNDLEKLPTHNSERLSTDSQSTMDLFQINAAEPRISRRLAWGGAWGAAMSLVCSAFAVLQFVLHARTMENSVGLTLPAVVAGYVIGFTAAGCLVGLFLPWLTSRFACAAVGVIAVIPIALLIQFMTLGDHPWTQSNSAVVIVGSFVLGIPLGILFFGELNRASERGTKNHRR